MMLIFLERKRMAVASSQVDCLLTIVCGVWFQHKNSLSELQIPSLLIIIFGDALVDGAPVPEPPSSSLQQF